MDEEEGPVVPRKRKTLVTAAVTPTTPKVVSPGPEPAEVLSKSSVDSDGEPYEDLRVPPQELRPSATLTTGQCFHWRAVVQPTNTTSGLNVDEDVNKKRKKQSAWGSHDATEWIGVLRDYEPSSGIDASIVVAIRETADTTLFRVMWSPPGYGPSRVRSLLRCTCG